MKKVVKNIIYIFFATGLVLFFNTSCQDELLNQEPLDFTSLSNSFENQNDALNYLVSVYGAFTKTNSGWERHHPYMLFDVPSHTATANGALENFQVQSNDGNIRRFWQWCYIAISRANTVIKRVGEMDNSLFTPSDLKQRIIAEAKFLRAYNYFALINQFGAVPLVLDEIREDTENAYPPRADTETIYNDLIIKELVDISTILPETYAKNEDKFRVTKWASIALLARVHLYRQEWEKAKSYALEVINEGPYALSENYAQTFRKDFEDNDPGRIFQIWYSYIDGNRNMSQAFMGPWGGGPISSSSGWGVVRVDLNFWKSWPNDFRKQSTCMEFYIDPASGDTTVHYLRDMGQIFQSKWIDVEAPSFWNDVNRPLLRLAEMHLIVAEAENELNGPTELALDHINKIRQRARNFFKIDWHGTGELIKLDSAVAGMEDLTTALGKSSLRDSIYAERDRELFLEWHALLDLKRTNRLEYLEESGRVSNITTDNYLYPIPEAELQVNDNLTQNPGY